MSLFKCFHTCIECKSENNWEEELDTLLKEKYPNQHAHHTKTDFEKEFWNSKSVDCWLIEYGFTPFPLCKKHLESLYAMIKEIL